MAQNLGLLAVVFICGLAAGLVYGARPADKDTADAVLSGDDNGEYKMVLVVRKDLPMTKGKVAAQCAHAALACYEAAVVSNRQDVVSWKNGGQTKIALQCDSQDELLRLQTRARRLGVTAKVIVDAGRTQIDPGSVTVLGVGPAPVKLVNEITGHLKLY